MGKSFLFTPLHYAVVSLLMRIGGITLCTGSIGCGRLFFRSSICADRISIASFAITGICCPTVLVGMTASREIGGYLITRKGNRIVTDRTAVYPSFEGAHLISETPDTDYNNPDGTCHLDVIVDSNLIEVYVNGGEYVISSTVYGLKPEIRYSGVREIRGYATMSADF